MDLQTNTGQSESVLLTFAKFIFRSSSQFNDKIEKQIKNRHNISSLSLQKETIFFFDKLDRERNIVKFGTLDY